MPFFKASGVFSCLRDQLREKAVGERFQAGANRLSVEILAWSDVAAGEVWRGGSWVPAALRAGRRGEYPLPRLLCQAG